jgi:type III pantothenate kinase
MDIGNTNIKLAVYRGEDIAGSWRVSVKNNYTADEFGVVFRDLFAMKDIELKDITGIIISSVVPSLNYTIEHMCTYYIGVKPIIISSEIETGIIIKYDNPKELGTDRIVNAVAAHTLYKGNCLIVDIGTATTFSLVSEKGEFLGGAIAPGIKGSVKALVTSAAKLPLIELVKPKKVIGTSTIENMQSGAIYGFMGLVEKIIDKIIEEAPYDDIKVIATGGLMEVIEGTNSKYINIIDRSLTLKGLKIIYDKLNG